MQNFKKNIVGYLLTMSLLVMLSACKSNPTSSSTPSADLDSLSGKSEETKPKSVEKEEEEAVPCSLEGEAVELAFDPSEKPAVVLINETEMNFVREISLSETNARGFVAYDPGATGTSLEDFLDFYVSCGEDNWVRVLNEYGRTFYVLDFLPHNEWATLVLTTNNDFRDDGMPVYRDGFMGYVFDGQEYVQLKAEIWMANEDLILRDAPKATPSKFESNEAAFGPRLIPTTAEELRLSLDNGQYFAYPTKAKGPEEKQVKASFYRYYPEEKAVVYFLEKYEETSFLWVELQDGKSHEFKGEPLLSPNGKRIFSFVGNLDQPEIKREIVLAERAGGAVAVKKSFLLPEASEFVLDSWNWADDKRLVGNVLSLNNEGALIESSAEIHLR